MNQQCHLKMAKNGLQLTSLIAPTILELEKSLKNKTFCSNNKLKILLFKLFFSFQFEFAMPYIFVSWWL